jgi:hypothetical protein
MGSMRKYPTCFGEFPYASPRKYFFKVLRKYYSGYFWFPDEHPLSYLNLASRQFGASRSERDGDASLPRVSHGRERRRCISILQTARNAADAPKLRDRLFRRTSMFLQDSFVTRWVSALADQPPAEKGKVVQEITCTLCLLTKYDSNADVRARFRKLF